MRSMGNGAKLAAAGLLLLSATAWSADQKNAGVSAGGKWMEFRAEDKMTAAQRVRFELPADNDQGEDSARVILYCTNGKLELADFRPNTKMAEPNRPSWWSGKPQMSVRVRVDQSHSNHNWNWVNGHFLAMDKDTARHLIGAHIFKVEFQTAEGTQIAEFSPLGLNLDRVKSACGLKPQKP